MPYLFPEFFFVFKCILGEIFINKYAGSFQLPAIFEDILFVFIIWQTTDDCLWFFVVLWFFVLWALSVIGLSSMPSSSLKIFLIQLHNPPKFFSLFL